MKIRKFSVVLVLLLLISNHSFAQFALAAIVPASTNNCYASGNFNSWSTTATPMNFVSNNNDGTKTFSVNIPLTFLNSGTFKILSGPAWSYGQADPQFSAVSTGISQTVTVGSFLAIFVPASVEPLSAHNAVYISSTSSSYSFVTNDFAFYNATGDTFSGVIITALPAAGTLTYNGVTITQTDVSQATVFSDRSKFAFTSDVNRTATSFSFKLKNSKNALSALSYDMAIKYNTPVSKLVRTANTNYIDYKGLPYLLYGIQLRIDDYLGSWPYGDATKWSNFNQYFEKTSLAGFRDAAVPVPWNYIETSDNVFNFAMIDVFLANANTYNLRLQFLWFGSNVCGWSNTPTYISGNTTDYPKISAVSGAAVKFDNPKLVEKEKRALTMLMSYIAQKDVNKRVVLFQVENEPDHIGPTTTMWGGGQKAGGYAMLDSLGQVIHRSPADMVTRVNLAGYTSSTDAAADFGSIKGINIVGRDFYADGLSSFLTGSSYFNYSWNLNYTPENGGQYKNLINLTLAAFDKGAGYINYELRTTGWRATQYDLGLYRKTSNNDWIARDGTQTVPYSIQNGDSRTEVNMSEVQDFNSLIYKADKRIAKSPDSKNAAFNLNDAQGAVNETRTFGSYTVTYSSPNGGEAFAMEDESGEIVLLSLKDNSSFTFQSLPTNFNISIGYFDDLNVWQQTNSRTISGKNVTLNAKEVALLTSNVYSGLSTVEEMKNGISISPNPTDGHFSLNVTDSEFEPNKIELISLDSRLVYSQNLSGKQQSFDVSSLKRGIYLLKLSGINTSKIYVEKLIIK